MSFFVTPRGSSIRMEDAPSKKRVPLQFQAWVLFEENSVADNIFSQSQLVLDRLG